MSQSLWHWHDGTEKVCPFHVARFGRCEQTVRQVCTVCSLTSSLRRKRLGWSLCVILQSGIKGVDLRRHLLIVSQRRHFAFLRRRQERLQTCSSPQTFTTLSTSLVWLSGATFHHCFFAQLFAMRSTSTRTVFAILAVFYTSGETSTKAGKSIFTKECPVARDAN